MQVTWGSVKNPAGAWVTVYMVVAIYCLLASVGSTAHASNPTRRCIIEVLQYFVRCLYIVCTESDHRFEKKIVVSDGSHRQLHSIPIDRRDTEDHETLRQ